ncbi:MAG TPA: ion transporter [Deltaproteobacteria bacterium]|nr:MAG: ion transporter [Deltaproteobacteria bacterium GWA2_55_82]OGQ62806.1 MAG: ion transporter [Deltaproteobacteria bacterium RIFCSPLOWO2_02_FULL_55_12]OIJ73526.1 MAG: ion transporter [Deltaproteobacteria bacterium GWC2_55_46]HBG46258.1 ion transporter [Deltaproteobacteria bacterium]HCY10165.1 ion transporter [Deltaproteobacteria bacterium]
MNGNELAGKSVFVGWRASLHRIIYEADTPAGKLFDALLISSILLSVLCVMLDSVTWIADGYGGFLYAAEWFFTILFTIEYALRLMCVARPLKYATSFLGVIDLLAIIPTYIDLFVPGGRYLLVVRVLRVLRIFRTFKLFEYLDEGMYIVQALKASRKKISIFLATVMTAVVVLGSLMYLVEKGENGFTSIPRSIYWAIVTLTTVGYGDIAPKTTLGMGLASVIMILGYGIIAVPTGIVTVEMVQQAASSRKSTQVCPSCAAEGHDTDALYCKFCGVKLN